MCWRGLDWKENQTKTRCLLVDIVLCADKDNIGGIAREEAMFENGSTEGISIQYDVY
jgi:hypothetical protein